MTSQSSPRKKCIPPRFVLLFVAVLAGLLALWLLRPKPGLPVIAPDEQPASETEVAAAPPDKGAREAQEATSDAMEQQWGIQLAGSTLTMGDSTLVVYYRVVDPEKASTLAQSTNIGWIVDRTRDLALPLTPSEPQQSPSRVRSHSQARSMALMMPHATGFPPAPNRLMAGRTYAVLLPNTAHAVKRGDQMALLAGDRWSANCTVEQYQVASGEMKNP